VAQLVAFLAENVQMNCPSGRAFRSLINADDRVASGALFAVHCLRRMREIFANKILADEFKFSSRFQILGPAMMISAIRALQVVPRFEDTLTTRPGTILRLGRHRLHLQMATSAVQPDFMQRKLRMRIGVWDHKSLACGYSFLLSVFDACLALLSIVSPGSLAVPSVPEVAIEPSMASTGTLIRRLLFFTRRPLPPLEFAILFIWYERLSVMTDTTNQSGEKRVPG